MTRALWQNPRSLRSAAASALIAVCAGGFGAVAASAKAQAQPRSTYPSANALAALGLKVTWPVTAQSSTVWPGSRLVVKVASTSATRHGTVARLTYARVGSRGQVLQTLARKQLQHGHFSVRVPRLMGANYVLMLRVDKLRYRSFVATPAPPLPATQVGVGSAPASTTPTNTTPASPPGIVTTPTPPSSPSNPPVSPSLCTPGFGVVGGTYSATLTVGTTSAQPGGTVPYTLQNTGTGCLEGGAGYGWQELVNGSWTDVPLTGIAFPSIAFFFSPGQTMNGSAGLPGDDGAGEYRLVIGLSEETAPTVPWTPPTFITLYSDPITVTAAPVATAGAQ